MNINEMNINEIDVDASTLSPLELGVTDRLDLMVMLAIHATDCATRAKYAQGEMADYLLGRARLAMVLSDKVNASVNR